MDKPILETTLAFRLEPDLKSKIELQAMQEYRTPSQLMRMWAIECLQRRGVLLVEAQPMKAQPAGAARHG